jgi:hypothetical protein
MTCNWVKTTSRLPKCYKPLLITSPYYPTEVVKSVAIEDSGVVFTYEDNGRTRYFHTYPEYWMYLPKSPIKHLSNGPQRTNSTY